jgi:tripartite-type tricarboxylate transporter receptor subunit TctC
LHGGIALAAYPDRPIKFVIPFAPGGGTDMQMRIIAPKLTELLGQQIILENRPGSGSTIGTEMVVRSQPDGYTFVVVDTAFTSNPALLQKIPYDSIKDLTAVILLTSGASALVVNPSVPAKTIGELIALAKMKNGAVAYASAGAGTSSHLTGELFKMQNKLFITHIPYRGTGPALQDVVAGQVDMMFDTLAGAAPFIKNGQLIAVAIASNKRSDAFPNVPTAQELGISNFVVYSWYAMWAIKGTPKDIVEKMSSEVQIALASPEIKERWAGLGASVPKMTRAELSTYISQEVVRWSEVVKKSNAKLD